MQADIDVILAREQQQLQQTYFGGGLAPSSPSVASPPEPSLSADVMASSASQPPPHATSHHKNGGGGGNPTPVERRRRRKLPLIERPRSAPIHATPETFLQNRVRKKRTNFKSKSYHDAVKDRETVKTFCKFSFQKLFAVPREVSGQSGRVRRSVNDAPIPDVTPGPGQRDWPGQRKRRLQVGGNFTQFR